MDNFREPKKNTSWVWQYFRKGAGTAKCIKCLQVLKNGRSTSPLMKHLRVAHAIFPQDNPRAGSSRQEFHQMFDEPSSQEMEQEQPMEPTKKKKQLPIDIFFNPEHSMRSDVLRLICETNISMRQIVSSETLRRLFNRAYPCDSPLPKSGSTLTSYLREDAEVLRNQLRIKLQEICSTGQKLSISFDEATVIGTDRYLTVNIHHGSAILGNSNIAALGLVRVKSRATGIYLSDLIRERLRTVGLLTKDVFAAATDSASNVLRAVEIMGMKKQKCFAHGLDLVVRKVMQGTGALAFEVGILDAPESEEAVVDNEWEEDSDTDTDEPPQRQIGEDQGTVCLGAVVDRLRRVVRDFKRKPNLMDEIRRLTATDEFNKKELRPILDCRTRWYSTVLMIERALRILPALNNVFSRHGTPISGQDKLTLASIAEALNPFKRAILLLSSQEATLVHADRVFTLLMEALRNAQSALAETLLNSLKQELKKRRTVLSTALAILDSPGYGFELESAIGQQPPSEEELLQVLAEIASSAQMPCSSRSNAAMKPAATLSWDSVFAAPAGPNLDIEGEGCVEETLNKELALFRLLKLCHQILESIPPTSVQPERDFSILRMILGENRVSLKPESLNDIFMLRRAFESARRKPSKSTDDPSKNL